MLANSGIRFSFYLNRKMKRNRQTDRQKTNRIQRDVTR